MLDPRRFTGKTYQAYPGDASRPQTVGRPSRIAFPNVSLQIRGSWDKTGTRLPRRQANAPTCSGETASAPTHQHCAECHGGKPRTRPVVGPITRSRRRRAAQLVATWSAGKTAAPRAASRHGGNSSRPRRGPLAGRQRKRRKSDASTWPRAATLAEPRSRSGYLDALRNGFPETA